jgi:manganese oxidase
MAGVDTRPSVEAEGASTEDLVYARHGAVVGPYTHRVAPRADVRGWAGLRAWLAVDGRAWASRIRSPLGALTIAILMLVGAGGYGLGAMLTSLAAPAKSTPPAASSGGMNMNGSGTFASGTQASVPDATQQYGGQPAKYVVDRDGAKHFSFTAEQVMWQPVKGHKVLAWTLDGTVPGPTIRVTAGDHVRITITNHFPEPTTLHWHGLQIPAEQDGVPGVGQQPIAVSGTFTYDFTVQEADAGTHFYHSHYDDLRQVSGGLYGAFIVDPRPGSPEATLAPKADAEYTEIISELQGYLTINGKSFPDTQPINVVHGQNVRVRLINVGEMMHPMHLHGHVMTLVAQDGETLPQPYKLDTLAISPGQSFDFTFNAWSAPGSIYPFHCHILSHVMNPGQTGDEMGGLIVLVEYAK